MKNNQHYHSTSSSATLHHSPIKQQQQQPVTTHRSIIVTTLLLCSSFAILHVHIGYKSLNHFRHRQRRIDQHSHDVPTILPNVVRRHETKASPRQQQHHGGRRGKKRMRVKSDTNTNHTVQDGSFITQLLQGKIDTQQDKRTQTTKTINRYKFQPGTLEMNSAHTLKHCHVDTNQYKHHGPSGHKILVSLSHQYKLIYRNIPKSSSSTSRHAMQHVFNGTDTRITVHDIHQYVQHNYDNNEHYQVFSFIRDPLSRFYSSYDEAYYRRGPWFGSGRLVTNRPGERKAYFKNKHKVDPYPYLYEGMVSYDDYRDKYCNLKNDRDCLSVTSIDNGDLMRRFEQFVYDYNGLDPFDVHLSLQVPFLVNRITGRSLPISELYNASDAERDWMEIAHRNNVTVSDGTSASNLSSSFVHGRKFPRRFNMSLVSEETKRKICKITMLDYCCLNLRLPEVCQYDLEMEEAEGVFSCAAERSDDDNNFYIMPWNDL